MASAVLGSKVCRRCPPSASGVLQRLQCLLPFYLAHRQRAGARALRLALFIAGSALALIGARAAEPAARLLISAAAAPQAAAYPHLPFYIARKAQTTIYLLGALHVGEASDYPSGAPDQPDQPFRPPIMAALSAASLLAFELSPDDLLDSQTDVQRYGMCAYACLPRLLPAALWRKLSNQLRGNQAALAEIRKTRPWLAALLIETFAALNAGLQTEYGTEAQLENICPDKRIVGLETLNEQIRAFTSLTLAQQREMLAQNLAQSPAQNANDMHTLHHLWRAGNADELAAWQARKSARLARSLKVSNAVDEKIIYRRNRRFTARMLLIVEPNEPIFVALGALHLGGPRGVLALLKRHGFAVQPG